MQQAPSLLVGHLTNFEEMVLGLQDDRPFPSEEALEHFGSAVMTELLDMVLGTVLEDRLSVLAEGLIGSFHSMSQRLERDADRARDQVKMLSRDFDGSEIADVELQEATAKSHSLSLAQTAVEKMRESASETYTTNTGEVWSPWKGNVRASRTTAAQIQARDMIKGRDAAKHNLVTPTGTLVAFRGAPVANTPEDASRIFDCLNAVKQRYPDMVLATTGASGAEKIAIRWANQKGVTLVLAPADFNVHRSAAPFKANDQLLSLNPALCITIPKSVTNTDDEQGFGPALNLGQKARTEGVKHLVVTAKA